MYKAYHVYFIAPGISGSISIVEKEENLDSRMREIGDTEVAKQMTTVEMNSKRKDRYEATLYSIREMSLSKIKISHLTAQDFLNLLKMNNQ
jgi:hypothetical protein